MLDNLRDKNPSSPFFQEDTRPKKFDAQRSSTQRGFLGMTAKQRFFLSVMFFLLVCIAEIMLLLITGKIVLPFLL